MKYLCVVIEQYVGHFVYYNPFAESWRKICKLNADKNNIMNMIVKWWSCEYYEYLIYLEYILYIATLNISNIMFFVQWESIINIIKSVILYIYLIIKQDIIIHLNIYICIYIYYVSYAHPYIIIPYDIINPI